MRIAFVVAIAACSPSVSGGQKMDSGTTKMDGSGSGSGQMDAPGSFDFGCGGGPSCLMTKVCCTQPGAMVSWSCVDPSTCQAANQITCDGPDECGGSTPVCCGTDVPDGTGNWPQCGTKSINTLCTSAAQCPTHIAQTCSGTSKVQICHVSAECTEATNNMCCTFMSNGAQLSFCIDQTTATLGGGVCH